MSEGELKMRLELAYVELCKKYREHENFAASSSKTIDRARAIIDEAKKDIENRCQFLEHCYCVTEMPEDSIIIPLKVWKKWFGDSSSQETRP